MMANRVKETEMKRIRERLYSHRHDSGLEVFVLPKRGYSKQFAIFATRFGSIDTRFSMPGQSEIVDVPDGIAHFLEHKLFEEQQGSIFDKFSELGASANAYTNFTNTAYLFSSTSNFYKCLEVLVKFVQNPYFTEQNVEKEKGIISQEIRMYDDNGEWRSFFNLLQAMYHRHPVRIDIAGTIESISRIDRDILYKCYNTFYHPDNMILFIAGDVDVDRSLDVVNSSLDEKIVQRKGDITRYYPEEPKGVAMERVEQQLAVAQPIFNIGFKDDNVGYTGDRLFEKEITTSILLEMLLGKGSDLYEQLYGQGLINNTFGFDFVAEMGYSYSIITGETPDPDRLAGIIREAVSNMSSQDFGTQDFDLARNKLLGRYLKGFNSLEYIASNFVSYHFKGINFLEFIDRLENMTLEGVKNRFDEHIKPGTMVMSVVLPKQ
jgi:predicted Zn-dependent peptidase